MLVLLAVFSVDPVLSLKAMILYQQFFDKIDEQRSFQAVFQLHHLVCCHSNPQFIVTDLIKRVSVRQSCEVFCSQQDILSNEVSKIAP